MKRVLWIVLFAFLQIGSFRGYAAMPTQGTFAFQVNEGPGVTALGDVLLDLKDGENIFHFQVEQEEDGQDVMGHYGILGSKEDAKQTVYYTYLKVGYIQDSALDREKLQGLIQESAKEHTVFTKAEQKEHILVLPDSQNEKNAFLGLKVGRFGVLAISTEFQNDVAYATQIFRFNEIMDRAKFIEQAAYAAVIASDDLYEKDLAQFLKDFNLMDANFEQALEGEDAQKNATGKNMTTTKGVSENSLQQKTENMGQELLQSLQTKLPFDVFETDDQRERKYPYWVIILGAVLIVSGMLKGLRNPMHKKEKKGGEDESV